MNSLNNLTENALNYMYFNIDRKYFEIIESKNKIKSLFESYWFKEEIAQIEIKTHNDFYKLNDYIEQIKKDKELFKRLFNYPLKRTGNAEVMLYLFIKNSYLSTSSTAGSDIIINDEYFEIKNCIISKKYKSKELYYSNFKLGNSFCVRALINEIENYFKFIPKGSEISEARNCKFFLEIEERYRDIVYNNYFSKHNIIFIDKEGFIKFVGKINKEDIFIDTITEGTIKPMIIINKENKECEEN